MPLDVRRFLAALPVSILFLGTACSSEPPPETPAEPAWKTGIYEGTATGPGDMEFPASLLVSDTLSGQVLIDGFRGFFNGPFTLVASSDSAVSISFHDGEGRELLAELRVSGDTLNGNCEYADGESDLSAELFLVFSSPQILTESEFYAACLFVPESFAVPGGFETEWCRIRMLTVDDAELDYEAVMSSGEMLRELSGGSWPSEDMTLEEDISDLEMHQSEHLAREAFTYTIVSLDEDSVLGCIYIMPPRPGSEVDAAVQFWLRQNLAHRGLDQTFLALLTDWIETDWPFEEVIYPGRESE